MYPDVDGVINSRHYLLLMDSDWKDEKFIARLLWDIDDARNARVLWTERSGISYTYFQVHHHRTGPIRAGGVIREMQELQAGGSYCFQLVLGGEKSTYKDLEYCRANAMPLLIFSSSLSDVIALAEQMRVPYHHWQSPQHPVKTFNPFGVQTLGELL